MEVLEHEHPLTLIDLQVQYQQEEEEDDEEEEEGGNQTTEKGFNGVKCGRCGEEIHLYHRWYYTCSSCDFSVHRFCGELSNKLDHPLHPHPPKLKWMYYSWECKICHCGHKPGQLGYYCSECDFRIDIKCAVEGGKNIIHRPCHPHLLTSLIPEPILYYCSACGKRHEGVFYQCTICVGFTIHSDCAFLPETLLIQQKTDNAFHHTHPLTISYSFPIPDQRAKHRPKCRVCGVGFDVTDNLWLYKCDKCMYYAHVDCATSRREPFMSIFLSAGLGKTIQNFKDADHPQLLHLPFPDETYSIPKHFLFQETNHHVNLTHASHEHPLTLVDCNGQTSSSSSSSEVIDTWMLKCHDPMKKTQLLCNGCLRPITSTMTFYNCVESCDFALHEWCTHLPPKIESHPVHPQHPLLLKYPNVLPPYFGVFDCDVCRLPCNGFAYCCFRCGYYVDVTCGFLPTHITHEAHPNHLLSLVDQPEDGKTCRMCLQDVYSDRLSFRCNSCHDINIHPKCALLLPKAIRHKYDKHPMHLSYHPIENHKSEYFCEICEEDLNPHESFYHCQHCAQSVHSACAPLILQSETETYSDHLWEIIYYFVNIKFGGIHNTAVHPHPLSFAPGTVSDGRCIACREGLQCKMIFKCLECKFAVDYYCLMRFYET